MEKTYTDLYVIGDKLQTIFNEDNAMTYLYDEKVDRTASNYKNMEDLT